MAHVINLIVQSILAAFNEAPPPDEEDWYFKNKHLPIHYDPDLDPDHRALEDEAEDDAESLEDALEFENPTNLTPAELEEVEILATQAKSKKPLTALQKVRNCTQWRFT